MKLNNSHEEKQAQRSTELRGPSAEMMASRVVAVNQRMLPTGVGALFKSSRFQQLDAFKGSDKITSSPTHKKAKPWVVEEATIKKYRPTH